MPITKEMRDVFDRLEHEAGIEEEIRLRPVKKSAEQLYFNYETGVTFYPNDKIDDPHIYLAMLDIPDEYTGIYSLRVSDKKLIIFELYDKIYVRPSDDEIH